MILQVDIVQDYRDTQTEINQLTNVQPPTLELADVKSLLFSGEFTKVIFIRSVNRLRIADSLFFSRLDIDISTVKDRVVAEISQN